MKVILVKDVANLGRSGDVKEVSIGYAKNYLFARKLALPATAQKLSQIQKEQQEAQAKHSRLRQSAVNQKAKLESKTFVLKAKAEKNRLFAAIHEEQIAQAVKISTGLEILPKQIILNKPLKTLGPAQAEVKLFEDLCAKIKLHIEII